MPTVSKKRLRSQHTSRILQMQARETGCYGSLIKDVIMEEIRNELSVQEVLGILTALPEDAECDSSDDDVDDEDQFDDIGEANNLLSAQCEAIFSAKDSYSQLRSNRSTVSLLFHIL